MDSYFSLQLCQMQKSLLIGLPSYIISFQPTRVEKEKWSFNLEEDRDYKEMIPCFVGEVLTICNTQEVALVVF